MDDRRHFGARSSLGGDFNKATRYAKLGSAYPALQDLQEFKHRYGSIIVKALRFANIPDIDPAKGQSVVFTNRVLDNDLEACDEDSISLLPQFFQQEITKKIELRVFATKNSIFSYAIDSQSKIESKIDSRIGVYSLDYYRESSYDSVINEKIKKYLMSLGLLYGVFDFIIDENNEVVFLECNVEGQWYHLESKWEDGIPNAIASAIAERYF